MTMIRGDLFDEAEWREIALAPYMAAAVVSVADLGRSGAENKELTAYREFLQAYRQRKRRNPLVEKIVEVTWDINPESVGEVSAIFNLTDDRNEEIARYVNKVANIVDMVRRKADPSDANSYVQFIVEGLEIVAKAYNESMVRLGNPISVKEGYYLRKFRSLF